MIKNWDYATNRASPTLKQNLIDNSKDITVKKFALDDSSDPNQTFESNTSTQKAKPRAIKKVPNQYLTKQIEASIDLDKQDLIIVNDYDVDEEEKSADDEPNQVRWSPSRKV